MKSYNIVGYVDDCTTFCVGCGNDNMEPIFADSEWDYYPSCDNCHGIIDDVSLTQFGQDEEAKHNFFNMLHHARKNRKA